MKIGIISIGNNAYTFNYGAYIQQWSFKEFLNSLDFVDSTEVIDYKRNGLKNWNPYLPFISYLRRKRFFTAFRLLPNYKSYWTKLKFFKGFAKKEMSLSSKHYYTQKALNNAKLDYDVIICESDTIWTVFTEGYFEPAYFLALDSMKNMKRIAYAPSMGDADFPDAFKNDFRKYLSNIEYISCRESYGVDLLRQYTDKNVELVLDPVFLPEPEKYVKLSNYRPFKEEYILIYQPMSDSPSIINSARKYSEKYGYKIVELASQMGKKSTNDITIIEDINPGDFTSLIRNSKAVFTNSFHATCFSILFSVDFYAFERGSCDKKVIDICSLFGLEDRYFYINDEFAIKDSINYDVTQKKLKELKIKSENWIKNALLS